ncbi:hypothetical protein PINS_up009728 [Pythium insidiosum]|nr:hypothetical protein PINS_up009728 [Pythium insidiosum]
MLANKFDLQVHTATVVEKERYHLVVGVHKALIFALAVYLSLACVLASSVDSTDLRSEKFVVQTVVDSTLDIPMIYIGITMATISSAWANVFVAGSILDTMRCNQRGRRLACRTPL